MKKLKTNLKINFEPIQEIWDELNYEIIEFKEKRSTLITEVKLPIKGNQRKVVDASTKLF